MCSCAEAAPARWPAACANALARAQPGWRHAVAPPDAAQWARTKGWHPTVAAGDFDGDGRTDHAALVVAGAGATQIAVCLGSRASVRLQLIEEPYCRDLLYRTRAGSLRHNYETDRDERIRHDGISVSCFEKAGATYVHERRRWRRIIDSD